ncbi:MAG: phospholipid carrier-dependent glycosyltransferase [Chloroflexi bacterium]|nr:phospholipid carrier-dependent glycosyltransferase [Chloroflexota bacterium]
MPVGRKVVLVPAVGRRGTWRDITRFGRELRSALPLLFVLSLALGAHSFNMLNYPIFDQDEGTYISSAWAILHLGKLMPYEYDYGHSPAGWIQLAAWLKASGGYWTFGSPLNSGRFFIMLLHIGSIFLLYKIALQLSRRKSVAVIAGFIFAVSPLAVAYQRRINLDNMMVFWVLLSFYLLVNNKNHLGRVALSAIAFGVAVLTKETAAFFLPVYLYVVWFAMHPLQRRMGLPLWTAISGSVVSIYFLYAALHGELFPAGTLLGGSGKHVSLLETLAWQTGRTGYGSILDTGSRFWQVVNVSWLGVDRLFFALAALAIVMIMVGTVKNRLYLGVAAIPVILFAYMARGGVIFDFYITPGIPFIALAIGLALGLLFDGAGRAFRVVPVGIRNAGVALLVVAAVATLSVYYLSIPITTEVFTANRTAEEKMALDWVAQNLPANTKMVVDNYAFTEMREGRPEWGGKNFPNVQLYWTIALDPDTRERVGIRTWKDIDYLLTTSIMVMDLKREKLQPMLEAYQQSEIVAKFDEVEVRKVDVQNADRAVTAGPWVR